MQMRSKEGAAKTAWKEPPHMLHRRSEHRSNGQRNDQQPRAAVERRLAAGPDDKDMALDKDTKAEIEIAEDSIDIGPTLVEAKRVEDGAPT